MTEGHPSPGRKPPAALQDPGKGPTPGTTARLPSFSAYSLQAYVDCARRFELSYLERLKWPAVESEPPLERERHLLDGLRFHEMIHRDVLGIQVPEPDSGRDPDIARWWGNYQARRPADVEGERFAEKRLIGAIGEHTLVATCDLIVIETAGDPGTPRRARIFDWKTWRRRHPRAWLAERLQTRVYPYLLAQAGAGVAGGRPPSPGEIEMVYWYADSPDDPEVFTYSDSRFGEDDAYLGGLVDEIEARDRAVEFELTADEKKCAFCAYRSFCGRGDAAGRPDEGDFEPEEETVSPSGYLDDYEAIAF